MTPNRGILFIGYIKIKVPFTSIRLFRVEIKKAAPINQDSFLYINSLKGKLLT